MYKFLLGILIVVSFSQVALSSKRGGQIYDNIWLSIKQNTPDILKDAKGNEIKNIGHDFLCSSCHGFDYKGANGILGEEFLNQPYAASVDLLLSKGKTKEELMEKIKTGGDGMPAYGEFFRKKDLKKLVQFIIGEKSEIEISGVFDTSSIYKIDKNSPTKFILNSTSDVQKEKGVELYDKWCAPCHGTLGDKLMKNGEYTLGSHVRQFAYNGIHKVVNGNPDATTNMLGMIDNKEELLSLFTALCNFEYFPSGGSKQNIEFEKKSCSENP